MALIIKCMYVHVRIVQDSSDTELMTWTSRIIFIHVLNQGHGSVVSQDYATSWIRLDLLI
jgi:hypothetical protein